MSTFYSLFELRATRRGRRTLVPLVTEEHPKFFFLSGHFFEPAGASSIDHSTSAVPSAAFQI